MILIFPLSSISLGANSCGDLFGNLEKNKTNIKDLTAEQIEEAYAQSQFIYIEYRNILSKLHQQQEELKRVYNFDLND